MILWINKEQDDNLADREQEEVKNMGGSGSRKIFGWVKEQEDNLGLRDQEDIRGCQKAGG